jgi:anti-anti-sigma factor
MPLTLSVQETKDAIYLVGIGGEVNTETYRQLEEALKPVIPKAQALKFDLKDLAYISSMGLGALFRIKMAMEEKGGTIALANIQPQIQTVFETMKVLPENMFASLEEADTYLDTFLDGIQKGKIQPHRPK